MRHQSAGGPWAGAAGAGPESTEPSAMLTGPQSSRPQPRTACGLEECAPRIGRPERVRGLDQAAQEDTRRGRGQLEAQRAQHLLLHRQDLGARVRVVGDVAELLDLRAPRRPR